MAGIQIAISHDDNTTVLKDYNSVNGSPTYSAGNGRNSTASLRCTGLQTATKTLPTALSTIYHAFSYRTSVLPGVTRVIAALLDVGTVQVRLVILVDGTMRMELGAGTATLATSSGFSMLANVTYHIEWKIVIHNSTGTATLWINEVQRANATGLDTQATANSTASQVLIGSGNENGAQVDHFDDHLVRDDQQIGDRQVRSFLPTGIGATNQWTAVGAATTREAVDEAAPNDDTDYAEESTVGEISLFTFGSIPSTSTIDAVIPYPYAKKTDAGTAKFKSVVRHSGVNYPGAEKAPSDGAYEYHPDILMVNPGTAAAFTAADWNAPIEIGVERTA